MYDNDQLPDDEDQTPFNPWVLIGTYIAIIIGGALIAVLIIKFLLKWI